MPTSHVRSATLKERWLLYDASKHPLGRLAADVAMKLMGKDLPTYTRSEKNGAFVIVVNAAQVRTTGTKAGSKVYEHYSGYPGGLKKVPFQVLAARAPEEIVRQAVKRMLPKNALGHDLYSRLKVYAGSEHPHAAQKPVAVQEVR